MHAGSDLTARPKDVLNQNAVQMFLVEFWMLFWSSVTTVCDYMGDMNVSYRLVVPRTGTAVPASGLCRNDRPASATRVDYWYESQEEIDHKED
jgi:hypothetical protein